MKRPSSTAPFYAAKFAAGFRFIVNNAGRNHFLKTEDAVIEKVMELGVGCYMASFDAAGELTRIQPE